MMRWLSGLFARRVSEPRGAGDSRIPLTGRTLAGVRITPDNAVQVSAVWACLRYLSQTVAVLPWHVMRQREKGATIARGHPVDQLLHGRPNPEWSSFQFRETLLHWALRWGNGYAEIERDDGGRPLALWPIHPQRVQPMRDEAGRLFFRVENGAGQRPTDLDFLDVFHLRGFGDGPVGVNVVEYAAETIGWARAAQLFGASFFGSGLNATGVITSTRSLSAQAWERLRIRFRRLYGGPGGERVLMLDNGMEFKPIAIEPEKGQFIETNQHLVEEICRFFGVPPHKVMHMLRSTNNNVEAQVVEVVVDSVGPWVKRFEDEADFKLLGGRIWATKMNLNALMRGDPASRAAFYQVMRQQGVFSANDILGIEDMDPIPAEQGGDKRVMQSQYTTLERIGEDEPAEAEPAEAEPAEPANDESPALMMILDGLASRHEESAHVG